MKILSLSCFIWILLVPAGFAIPTIQHWETATGTRVYFVPRPELPMVDVEITFAAGSARDGEKSGLASLTNSLLEEGADGLTVDQIAEKFDQWGARSGFSVDNDMASVSLRSLNEPELLQAALDLLGLLLTKPDFPQTAFLRVQQRTLASLKTEQQYPASIATRAFNRAVFGEHPYAQMSNGTLESVNTLQRADAIAFHRRYYVAKNALIAIVGAVTRPQAEQIAQTLTQALPTGEPAPALPPVKDLTEAKTLHLNFPSAQTHILLGQPGLSRLDPDYFTLYVGNHILGGSGLVSLLMKEIREQQGFVYSVYSYFDPLQEKGAFSINLATRKAQQDRALQMVNAIVKQFLETGPTPKQLEDAQKNITGRYAASIDSNGDLLGYLTVIGFYRLPLDYLHTRAAKIQAVTREMIQETFKRRLNLDKLVTVTVGN